jgi:AraC-like DNA-binding protein
MQQRVAPNRLVPYAHNASAISTLLMFESDADALRIAMPRPEVQLVVRLGTMARGGVDLHAFGVRESAHRKRIQSGQRSVTARLRLGVSEAVLGVPASSLSGRIVALDDLWGHASVEVLRERLVQAPNLTVAAQVLDAAIAARLARNVAPAGARRLALAAAERLDQGNVTAVAGELGISERHLRRVFREEIGVSPKVFAKLTRFQRALQSARQDRRANWGSIAQSAGYYDQAHLIAEFRSLTGVTPRALLSELAGVD